MEYNQQKNLQKIISKSSDYTLTVSDVLSGNIFVADTTADNVFFTLPKLSTLPADSMLRSFSIGHSAGDNDVFIKTDASDSFVFSSDSTTFNLGHGDFHFTLAGVNTGTSSRWGFQRNLTIMASTSRTTSWASSNFSSVAVIPFESENYNNNPELFVFTSGSSAKYQVKTGGTFKVGFSADIDSTGGSTWNAIIQLYKNGVAVDNSDFRSGNYGNEDQSIVSLSGYIDLVDGDYLDVRINQNNLTGNLINAVFNIESRL